MSFTEHNVNGVIFDTAGTLSVGGVRHAFTTRHGGVSPAPFDSLNLASNRGDREENILENYRRLGAAVEPAAAVAVPAQHVGGHGVGAAAVVDRGLADPRGGRDLAELIEDCDIVYVFSLALT